MDDKNEYEYGVDFVKEHSKQGKELEEFQDNLKRHFKSQRKDVDIFVPQMWGGFTLIVRVSSDFKEECDFLSLEGVLNKDGDEYSDYRKEIATEVGYRQQLTFSYFGHWSQEQFTKVAEFCKKYM